MTLRMADGPVANLPPGMDAYAGYVNASGIGTTYPAVQVLAAREKAIAFSITTNGSPAQCADVEAGAMSTWKGYRYGYCAVSNVNALIASQGRPAKLWTSHYDPKIGKHICSPECWPGLATTADGTQWVDHGGWDESLLAADFFELAPPPLPPLPLPIKEETMSLELLPNGTAVISAVGAGSRADHLLVFTLNPTNPASPGYNVIDVTDGIGTSDPYTVSSA
jgi:hypothetical protein